MVFLDGPLLILGLVGTYFGAQAGVPVLLGLQALDEEI
jgi:hypothetical protein